MLERFLKQAEQIVADHKAQYKGVYYMKGGVIGGAEKILKADENILGGNGWNAARDTLETGAVLAGNYLLPGSSLVTSNIASKGAKELLNSGVGKVGQVASGLAGAGVGSGVTGVPQSAGGAAEASLLSSVGNAAGNATSAVGNAFGTADAAPWVDPDITAAGGAGTANAAPWVNPDAAVAPSASAAGGTPMVNPNNITGSGLSSISAPAPGLADAAPNALSPGETSFLGKAGVTPSTLSPGEASFLDKAGASAPSTGTALSSLAAPAAAAPSTLSSIKPWIGPAISGAGLAMSAIKGAQPIPAENALKSQAATDSAQGAALQNYLPSGTLPPGAQAGIDQAKNAAKAAIRSKYASMGMSGSSSEQQELSAADSRAQAEGEQQALQLLNTGISESNMSSQLYESILNNTMQNDQALSSAVSGFAGSVAGAVNPSAAKSA